jgi:FMN phosphatase YigB (HAD superfamily)
MNHICFDIGNVLMHVNFEPFYKKMENTISSICQPELFLQEMEKLDFLGATDLKKALKWRYGIKNRYDYEELKETWNKTIIPNDQMMNFISSLKYEGIKIALLSNMGRDHAEYIRKVYPELFDVDVVHLSYEVGSFKPQKLFYQSFLLSHEEFSGSVYLDDNKENVIIGAKFKFNAIYFNLEELTKDQNPSVLKKTLNNIKNKILLGY